MIRSIKGYIRIWVTSKQTRDIQLWLEKKSYLQEDSEDEGKMTKKKRKPCRLLLAKRKIIFKSVFTSIEKVVSYAAHRKIEMQNSSTNQKVRASQVSYGIKTSSGSCDTEYFEWEINEITSKIILGWIFRVFRDSGTLNPIPLMCCVY